MKKNIFLSLLFLMCTSFTFAQKTKAQKKLAGEFSYDSECVGVELDGSQTLKAYGYGNSKNDAVEQAKKNAVRDVLFKGILKGKNECSPKPLVNDPNAQTKFEDYFNKFFADGGEYLKYTSMNDMPIKLFSAGKDRKTASNGVTYGITVIVKRSELKKRLIADNILPNE